MTVSVFPVSHGWNASGFLHRAWKLTHPYWHSEEWLKAWALLLFIIGLSFANVGMAVLYNNWNRDIYNALESRDAAGFSHLLLVFLGVAAVTILMSAYSSYLTKLLKVRWRRWLFYNYSDAWLKDSRHYQVQLQQSVDNPDQRLTEDINAFTRLTLSTVLGFIHTLSSLVTFSIILWTASGDLDILGITIPGYMFWAALIYSVAGSLLTHWLGRHLIGLNNHQQKVEADVRFDLMRIRENGENIALQRGETGEQSTLRQRFDHVWSNFHTVVRSERNLSFFVGGYSQFSFLFPFAVAGPRLFSGSLQLGEFMQLNQAFGNLQNNLSWFIAVYHDLVEWRAVTDRLLGFDKALSSVMSNTGQIRLSPSTTGRLELAELQTRQPDGKPLLQIAKLSVSPGQHVLVQGASGCGKSTLLRAVAGIWRYGEGEIRLPGELYVIPQRPYFPVGTLRNALLYPVTTCLPADDALHQILQACRLGHLQSQLDLEAHWEKRLSPGEQQRLAIARALLVKPDWLLLDEATSALSLADEERVYRLIRQDLPACTIVSVGHRESLKVYHHTLWQVASGGEVVQTSIANLQHS